MHEIKVNDEMLAVFQKKIFVRDILIGCSGYFHGSFCVICFLL